MKTPILGQSYVVRSLNAAAAHMVNLYPEALIEGKEAAYLQRCPGLRRVVTVGTGPIRGLWSFGGYLYAVSGIELYKINSSYSASLIGTVFGTGPVSMSDNGAVLFVACNGPSFTYNSLSGDFRQISSQDFPGAQSVGYLDGYFVFNEPNSQRIYVVQSVTTTGYIYPLVFDALDFASAEGSPDGVVSLIVDHREVWVFGTNSVEVWYDSGAPDFPLQRIQGAFNELGCVAPYSVAKLDNTVFWLGADARGQGIVYRANGYNGQRVSTHAVEFAIQGYGNISDAIAYTYQQDGHSFYVLTFPSANKTWVYDAATQAWHERAGWSNGQFTRHRSNCQAAFNSEVLVGDYENGKIYAYDLDVYADDEQTQKWLRSWRALPPGQNNLKRTAHHALQLDAETGVGNSGYSYFDTALLLAQNGNFLTTQTGGGVTPGPPWSVLTSTGAPYTVTDTVLDSAGAAYSVSPFVRSSANPGYLPAQSTQGQYIQVSLPTVPAAAPQVMLRWSDDGGHTWSNEHWRQMGRIGEYGYRTIWRRLGMTVKLRDRVYEVSGTDPVKIAILGAELQISPTDA